MTTTRKNLLKFSRFYCCLICFVWAVPQGISQKMDSKNPAFEKLKTLEGEWIDELGTFAGVGEVGITYRVIASGSSVVETMFPGKSFEMLTVYHLDGKDLVLTHYCAAGNQPKLKASPIQDKVLKFEFVGGTNFHPASDNHMHEGWIEFLDENHIKGSWIGWANGKPSGHKVTYQLSRKRN